MVVPDLPPEPTVPARHPPLERPNALLRRVVLELDKRFRMLQLNPPVDKVEVRRTRFRGILNRKHVQMRVRSDHLWAEDCCLRGHV